MGPRPLIPRDRPPREKVPWWPPEAYPTPRPAPWLLAVSMPGGLYGGEACRRGLTMWVIKAKREAGGRVMDGTETLGAGAAGAGAN